MHVLERIRRKIKKPPKKLLFPDPNPWIWIGGMSKGHPTIWYNGGSCNVARVLYAHLVSPIYRWEILRPNDVVSNVNPRFYKLLPEMEPFPVSSGVSEEEDDFEEICELIEGEWAKNTFASVKDIRKHFDLVLDDVEDSVIIRALRHLGLDRHMEEFDEIPGATEGG